MEIDLVYLWVDGSDPVWRAKKNTWFNGLDEPQEPQVAAPLFVNKDQQEQAAGACRFADNDELKYSLRSVERFAPWVRHIYLVTDGQTPAWLDTSNPRIRVVDHREIVPEKYLPLFNSNALEFSLDAIPGLSEYFLYANDDMLFGGPAEPGFFFDKQGRPIVRVKTQSIKRHLTELYSYQLYRMLQAIKQHYGKHYSLVPHHNIDAYRLCDIKACKDVFGKEIESVLASRFRNREDLQRSVVLYSALARGSAKMRRVTRFNQVHGLWALLLSAIGRVCGSDSRCIPLQEHDPEGVMEKYRPTLFCVNDSESATDEDRVRIRRFLEKMFPDKSQFER